MFLNTVSWSSFFDCKKSTKDVSDILENESMEERIGKKRNSLSRENILLCEFILDIFILKIPTIETHIVDLTDWDATRKVLETIDPVELLVNNAGASVSKEFLDVTKESLYR